MSDPIQPTTLDMSESEIAQRANELRDLQSAMTELARLRASNERWQKIAIDLVCDHNADRIESHVAAARRAMIDAGMTDPWPNRTLYPKFPPR